MSGDGFEEVNILRKDAPDVVFKGKLVAEVSSRDASEASARRSSDRWTELAVYELESGDWVAVSVACSDKPGETDFGNVRVIPVAGKGQSGADAAVSLHAEGALEIGPARTIDDRRRDAMDFFGWTWLAKKLADEAGWDVRERIG